MLHQMSVPFFLMTPFNEPTRLRGLLSCFLSALQFQSWAIGTKAKRTAEKTTIITLYIILQKKKNNKIKIKDFSEVIKITKKLSEKTFKTWKLFLNIYYWIYFFEFWDR